MLCKLKQKLFTKVINIFNRVINMKIPVSDDFNTVINRINRLSTGNYEQNKCL